MAVLLSLPVAPYESPHDKTTKWHVRPAKTDQPGASAQSDQSLHCALNRVTCKGPMILHVGSED